MKIQLTLTSRIIALIHKVDCEQFYYINITLQQKIKCLSKSILYYNAIQQF